MSHGQTGRLAINSNAAIINTKILNCGGGEMGRSAISKGANSVSNKPGTLTFKMNSKQINDDEQYTTVTITSPAITTTVSQSVDNDAATAINATIEHSKVSSGKVIHLIPLQVGNVTTTASTAISPTKTQQMAHDKPLTIISKCNKINTQQNQLIESVKVAEIDEIIETSLSSNQCVGDPLTVAALCVGTNIGVSRGLANTLNSTNVSAGIKAAQATSINSAVNGSSVILVHNQIPKTSLQRIPIAPGEIASVKSVWKDDKITSKLSVNENVSKLSGKPATNNELKESPALLPSSAPDKFQNFIMFNQKPDAVSLTKTAPLLPVGANIDSCHSTIDAIKTIPPQHHTFKELTTPCILSDDCLNMTSPIADVIENNMSNSNSLATSIIAEELDRSDPTLIIDDSNDDDSQDDKMIDIHKSIDVHSSPTAVTHISNSVVLTKAKAVDSKTNGGPRHLSAEPANVVLMKLPNAAQQATGTTNPRVEISITEAFTLATNADKANAVKIVSTPKMLVCSPKNQHSSTCVSSNSIPVVSQSLSPRASKRCQSLNSGQLTKLTLGLHQAISPKNVELTEKRRYSNPVKSLIAYSSNTGLSSEPITDQIDSSSSSDELNKENNDITFIELDDSFAEDFSEDSNVADNVKHEKNDMGLIIEESQKSTQEDHVKDKSVHLNFKKEKNLIEKTSNDMPITKDQNANTTNLPSITISDPSFHPYKHSLHSTSVATKKMNSEKCENDQIIKSLLCNENIKAVTPSSSSSASSAQEPFSSATCNSTQGSSRAALTPRVRDHNRIVDANAATARRLCRDSSIASALSMVSTFDMLNWKEDRIASARGTTMRFELNEFNLLQVHERGCPPRYRIHTPYERPIYERFRSMPKTDQSDPLLYMCRTCKLYGPAVDFLAPEFCSAECLKRTFGKRGSRDTDILDNIDKKRSRKSAPASNTITTFPTSNTSKQAPTFRWSTYLSNMRNSIAAPIDLFLNPFPTGPNPFLVGMKIEAIDPENCSLFCVCTIVQIQGYRLRVHFDGYNSVYDFWVNADSMDIFPPGWCGKTNRILQPPRFYERNKFDWAVYLKKTNSIGADKKLFTHLNSASMSNRNPFTVGMFLEADDLNDTGKLCVASVADVLDERIRVHFDGWDDCYDYWVDISSPYIHPCGWHEGRQQLLVPPEYSNTSFNWRDYIRESQGLAAPTDFFVSRDPIDYRPGMKLEVVDPRNPSLIRPATVVHRTRHRVKIHFDCWPPEYIFSLEDDSPDLHPIGWCDATGHELEPPPNFHQQPKIMPCNTIGCRGIGNMDRSKGLTHATREYCPYVVENWRSKPEKTPRVEGKDIVRKVSQETNSSSLLKNMKRQCNQSENTIEIPKLTEKLVNNMPYKQPTRGRPRNCDRLAAAAAAAAAVAAQQQQERHSTLSPKEIKAEDDNGNSQVKKKLFALENLKSESTSTSTTASLTTDSESKMTIAKQFLCDYGPRLQQNYVLWRQNTSFDIASKVQRNPLLWSTAETCAFIDAVLSECHSNTARYAVSSKFYKHDIDGAALLMLQQRDLMEILQFKIGPAVKLCTIILQLRMLVVSKYGSSITRAEAVDQKIEIFKNDSDLPE